MPGIWSDSARTYTSIELESHKVSLHPVIREQVGEFGAKHVLDFGCGDGSLFAGHNLSCESLCLYDTSEQMIEIARKRFGDGVVQQVRFETEPAALPDAHYQLVVCSLVFMTVPTEAGLADIAATMSRCLVSGGRCMVAITHPCFRQYAFSTFATEFCHGTPYPYQEEGTPFRVTLHDRGTNRFIEFTDFHWSLSANINVLLKAGLRLVSVLEIPDEPVAGSGYNPAFPGYMLLVCEKP